MAAGDARFRTCEGPGRGGQGRGKGGEDARKMTFPQHHPLPLHGGRQPVRGGNLCSVRYLWDILPQKRPQIVQHSKWPRRQGSAEKTLRGPDRQCGSPSFLMPNQPTEKDILCTPTVMGGTEAQTLTPIHLNDSGPVGGGGALGWGPGYPTCKPSKPAPRRADPFEHRCVGVLRGKTQPPGGPVPAATFGGLDGGGQESKTLFHGLHAYLDSPFNSEHFECTRRR